MHKYFFAFLLFCFPLSACKKASIKINVKEIHTPITYRLNKIGFFNSLIGFAVGGEQFSAPSLLISKDGGISWQVQNLPENAEKKEIYGMAIHNSGTIITVGYGGTIYYSNDTGKNFEYRQHTSWKELKSISFRDDDTSYIAGGTGFDAGHVSAFKNDGTGSNQIQTTWNLQLSDIHFCDKNTGYICGYGAVLKTKDGGKTWNYTSAKNDFFTAMCWKNQQVGIVVGYEGSILKTIDGGATWQTIRNGNSVTTKKQHFLDVDRNTQNKMIAVGENGLVCISSNDGDSWQETHSFTNKDLRGITFRDDQNSFIVGEQGSLFHVTE